MLLANSYDVREELFWDNKLRPWVICNDFFAWGCADGQGIETEEDLALFEQSLKDSEYQGPLLYCARKRKMRPQGAYYKYLQEDIELFNACGPERGTGFGNPLTPEQAIERYNREEKQKRINREKRMERPNWLNKLVEIWEILKR